VHETATADPFDGSPTILPSIPVSRFFSLIVCLSCCGSQVLGADDSAPAAGASLPRPAERVVDFQRDIQPIFARACLSCHGGAKQKGGLRLDDAGAALKGGNSGPVLQPGDDLHSRLLLLVGGLDPELKMPPRGKPLTGEEIGLLRAWIDQGARWPRGTAGPAPAPSKPTHWAFVPPRPPPAPNVVNASWARNAVDRFVLARLEVEKIAPSPEADRVTLLRRLSFDLLGLPPGPREVEEFVQDPRPDAYERLVERLLQSPHYGERWGRHWLDLARYADSDGFEGDAGRPFAWRYRNWVIDALNRDMPFDRFTIEQLAGDLVPGATTEQRIATGFHRNTLTNREGGVDQEQFRVEQVVDRVNTTAKVFLGMTMGCAQCHDHKYDPFSQRDYYQLFAFFNNDVELDLPAPLPGELDVYRRKQAVFAKKKAELEAAMTDYLKTQLPARQQKWENDLRLPQVRKLPKAITAILLLDPAKRTAQQIKELEDFYAGTDKKLAELKKAVADHQKAAPVLSKAQTLALGSPRKTHVLIRGDFLRPGALVEPGIPAIFSAPQAAAAKSRLDLAQWIIAPENPLTARVIVNWIWQHYFGRGIVASPEDFGTQGERPSHPDLLDYLATEFMRQKGSLKAMHRLIVTSATYRQSANARPELTSRDPLNVLLARQNRPRLEAEIIRDRALAVSGLLNETIGGPSVRPPQPTGISELTYSGKAKWIESTGPDRYRRGMYTWFQRTSPYPMLMTFDEPDSYVCCVRRERSNTPLQALTLLNDTVFLECARALAARIMTEERGGMAERIRHAYRLGLSREPTSGESALLGQLFEELLRSCGEQPEAARRLAGNEAPRGMNVAEAAAWVAVARTVLNLDEFVTRD
jgi:hypothetical protein